MGACDTIMYDVSDDSENWTTTHFFIAQASNSSVANIAQIVLAETIVADSYLQQYAALATFSNTAHEMADRMALSYSKAAMSFFSQSIVAIRYSLYRLCRRKNARCYWWHEYPRRLYSRLFVQICGSSLLVLRW